MKLDLGLCETVASYLHPQVAKVSANRQVFVGKQNEVVIYDSVNGSSQYLNLNSNDYTSLVLQAFFLNSNDIIVATDKGLYVYNLLNPNSRIVLNAHTDFVSDVAVDLQGKYFITSSLEPNDLLLELQHERVVYTTFCIG